MSHHVELERVRLAKKNLRDYAVELIDTALKDGTYTDILPDISLFAQLHAAEEKITEAQLEAMKAVTTLDFVPAPQETTFVSLEVSQARAILEEHGFFEKMEEEAEKAWDKSFYETQIDVLELEHPIVVEEKSLWQKIKDFFFA